MSMEEGVKKYRDNLKKATGRANRKIALRVGNRLIENTPKLTGKLANSWSLGSSSQREGNLSASEAKSQVKSAAAKIRTTTKTLAFEDLSFKNPTPYLPHVEYGTQKMAPRYFIRRTRVESIDIILDVLKEEKLI